MSAPAKESDEDETNKQIAEMEAKLQILKRKRDDEEAQMRKASKESAAPSESQCSAKTTHH